MNYKFFKTKKEKILFGKKKLLIAVEGSKGRGHGNSQGTNFKIGVKFI
jgi:hypothetical protein